MMASRRPTGALEADVLGHLWRTEGGATPGQVAEALDADIAYTTVMTVLTRLWRKGLVERQRQGRAYQYCACVSEADHAAGRMREALGRARDSEAVLSRFVDTLSCHDADALRHVLERLDEQR